MKFKLALATMALIGAGCTATETASAPATPVAPVQMAAAAPVAPAAAATPAARPAAAAVAPSASLAPPADAPPPKPQPPGPHAVSILSEASLNTHTVYRPTDLSAFSGAKRLPIVAWGNGACSNAGLLFQTFLKQIASHGFVVIASGPKDAPMPSFSSGGGADLLSPDPNSGIKSAMTKDADLIKAIDWAIAENSRAGSPYQGHLDPSKVAVMGQSCGGLQATAASGDPRVKTVVIWNSGVFNAGAPANPGAPAPTSMSGANKDMIAKFHAPVAYFLGGPSDVAYANGKDDFSRVTTVPAFLGSIHSGHGGTYRHPGGGWFGETGVAWLKWQLNGDAASAKYFEGADCILCKNPIWEVAKKNMK
jgi:dienelactone hydrolase